MKSTLAFAILLAIGLDKVSVGQETLAPEQAIGLKDIVGDRFKMGVGVSEQVVVEPACAELICKQFQILTPENCMKPQGIHPAENRWNYEAADRFVAFAKQHDLEIVGHCLVWAKDDRTDEWMKVQENGEAVSRAKLLERIEDHVTSVVKRYHETATMWDVVNEAISDGDDGYLRDSIYSKTSGIDFIETAFRAARKHDPDALLIYNDYNCHLPNKRKKIIRLLSELKERGVPIDAYGIQGHFELGDNTLDQLRETLEALRKLGIKVVISELDIDVVTRGRWWADDGKYRDELKSYDPYKNGLPKEIEQQQLEQYVGLFRLFEDYDDIIARVSFWNLHDGQSWLNYFPWDRTNYPLLFDRDLRPKPVYDAVLKVLQGADARNGGGPGHTPKHSAVQRTDPKSQAAHQQLLQKAKEGRIDIYFQGDSITRRWGASDYPAFLEHWRSSFFGWNAANFAWGGDNTHNILWRMQNGELEGVSPKIVVLQAGTNNLPWQGPATDEVVDDVVAGIDSIIEDFKQRVPESVIVLTALFPRDQNTDLSPAIKKINARIKSFADNKRIRFVDINSQLTDSEGKLLPGFSKDGLHLEIPAYAIWAAALRPTFDEILGPPAKTDDAPGPTGDNSKAAP